MTLISERLKSVNYATVVAGKWNAGAYFDVQLPTNRGYDRSVSRQCLRVC